MTYHIPIAYAYEAAHHCEHCTRKRFGDAIDKAFPPLDNEGNEVHAVFSWEEWWNTDTDECETLNCDDCHAELDCAHTRECQEDYTVECIMGRPRCEAPDRDDPNAMCGLRFDDMGDCPYHGKIQTTIF